MLKNAFIPLSVVITPVISSKYMICLTLLHTPGILRPLISSHFLILFAKGSIHKTNNNGERLQPCLKPRCNLKGFDTKLFTITEDEMSLYKICIQFKKDRPKPAFFNTVNMYFKLTLS